ncbi:hypothetical protein B0H12DRAFT_1323309 [Mycena haematopus]|nr:hypothetical protein B0H12DRAFT_1323309 [Mycena haematopus]
MTFLLMMVRVLRLVFLLGIFLAFATHAQRDAYFIPSAVQTTASQAQFISDATLDGPKVHPINASVFDWWYFDVVSLDPSVLSSVVVTFFTTPQSAFPLLPASDSITLAYIWVSFPNGTLWAKAVSDLSRGATVEVAAGAYLVVIDAPDFGVTGTISFQPTAPAHYPCGPVAEGQSLKLSTHLGWENVIPDAVSVVDLRVDGVRLAFTGSAYHDKNWSDQPFGTHVASWYWGRGRLGAYSIVWWDILGLTGEESLSAYVARDNKIISASCKAGSVTARPVGENATYPPVLSTPNPAGYHVEFDLGKEGRLEVDVLVLANLIDVNPEYARFMGSMEGVVSSGNGNGDVGEKLVGMALFEQFKLTE